MENTLDFKDVDLMDHFKTTPQGLLFNVQLDRPTKKYNRKVGTFHVGLRLFDKEIAESIHQDMKKVQHEYAVVNNITNESYLTLPFFDTSKIGLNEGYEINPFRMNSCGWSGKLNNVYVNIPRVFDITGKEQSHEKFNNSDKEYWGRIFYGIEGYNNQEGIGVVLRLRGVQLIGHEPRNKIAS